MVDEPIAEKTRWFQRWKVPTHATWRALVDLVTPPLCLVCQTPVTMGAALCVDCWQTLHFIDEPVCEVLGLPFAYDEGEGAVSPAAIADPPRWDKARAAVVFDDASKPLVHALKYRDQHEVALAMAAMMQGAARNLFSKVDVVVPVPLHRRRLWRRRFNQAVLLARPLALAAAKPLRLDVLERVEITTSQVGLDATARQRNVRKAFAISPDKQALVDGKTVLLVDDVRTTGATANACADTLKKAGATNVFVLSFALVLEPQRLHIDA